MSIKHIQSRDNAQYKEVRQLATSSQARRKAGKTLLDGIHLCEAWLRHRGSPLLCVAGESAQRQSEASQLIAACVSQGTPVMLLPDALFAPLSQVEHGIALLFVVHTPASVSKAVLDAPALLLDGLQDPGNLGSILRTAAAAGIAQVFCGPETVFAWSPKVLRAGMGAHFALHIIEGADLSTLIRNATVPVYATTAHAQGTLYELDLRGPLAWLFGQEGRGVAPELLALASKTVAIPQASAVESLNVAASVAICLFEQRRQQLAAIG